MIDRRQLPLNALRAFEAVARRGGFTAGAQALSVTQSVVSRHIAHLEDILGRKLIDRSAQGFVLTPEGAAFLPVVERAFDDIQGMMNRMGATRTLTVHMPPALAQGIGMRILRDFRHAHPDISIRVGSSYVTGPPDQKVDVAILFDRMAGERAGRLLLRELVFTPLCSPAVAARAAGKSLSAFLEAEELLHVLIDGEPYDHLWSEYGNRQGLKLPAGHGLTFESFAFAADYAARESGVALGEARSAAQSGGRLIAPFPETAVTLGFGYFLSTNPEEGNDPVIETFRKWVVDRFSEG